MTAFIPCFAHAAGRARARVPALMSALACAFASVVAQGAPATGAPLPDVTIDASNVYPESMSSGPDGTLYIGSMKGTVYRARPGQAKATAWVQRSDANHILSLLGVLVDAPSHTLWLCSAAGTLLNPPIQGTSSLIALDLATGKPKGNWPFPAPVSTCNDITVAPDGSIYATDTPNGRIFHLAKGAAALELFVQDPVLRGIDGIVFSGDGLLYVNNVQRNQLLLVDVRPDGKAGPITPLELSQPVAGPDGFRLIEGKRFLLAEGNAGRIDEVTIHGARADIKVLRTGLISPPAVTLVGHTVYALEGKISYLFDPHLKGQDPGAFKAYAVPLNP